MFFVRPENKTYSVQGSDKMQVDIDSSQQILCYTLLILFISVIKTNQFSQRGPRTIASTWHQAKKSQTMGYNFQLGHMGLQHFFLLLSQFILTRLLPILEHKSSMDLWAMEREIKN